MNNDQLSTTATIFVSQTQSDTRAARDSTSKVSWAASKKIVWILS